MATKPIAGREIAAEASDTERAEEFVNRFWRPVLVAAVVLGAGFIGYKALNSNRAGAEKDAHGLWLRAQQDLSRNQYASALDIANTIRDKHANTPSGRRALLVKADALLGTGDRAGAKVAYSEAAGSFEDPILKTSARRGLAVLLEDDGDAAGAAEIYQDLGNTAEPTQGRVFDLQGAGRCYVAAGQPEAAIAALEQLVNDFSERSERAIVDQVNLAEIQIAEIKTKMGG